MNKHQNLSGMLMHQLPNCQCCQQTTRKALSWELSPFHLQAPGRFDTGLKGGRAQGRHVTAKEHPLNVLLAPCWMHSAAPSNLCAASLLHPSAWGWGAPGQAQGFHMQDWNSCLKKSSLKSWPQAIGINQSWTPRYNDFLLQRYYRVFSLWPGPFSLLRGDPYSWHSFFLSHLMRF